MNHYFLRWIWITIFTFFFIPIDSLVAQEVLNGSEDHSTSLSSDFHQLYIVFAGPYPASPSSSFGHLFLLTEPSNSDNLQMWDAINFAADVQDESGASSLYNGLIGNLEGNFEILPFYKMIQDYSYSESRDLWLFPIHLESHEKQRFTDYINHTGGKARQYRFSDKNCASRVSEALHYVFNQEYSSKLLVLPQQVLNDDVIAQRLSEPLWIENVESQMLTIYTELDNAMSFNSAPDSLSNTERVKFLKTYEWLYNNTATTIDNNKRKFIEELRFKVSQSSSDYDFTHLNTRDFTIHHPGRFGASYGYNQFGNNYVNLDIRLGLHDFNDVSVTYPKFDYINVFSLSMLFSDRAIVEEFWVFNQESRQPVNHFNTSPSWSLGFGGQRYFLNDIDSFAMGIFTGIGRSYSIFDDQWNFSLLLNANPVYITDDSFSIIIEPKLEQRIFFTDTFKLAFGISNPVYLKSNELLNIHLDSSLVLNLNNNVSLTTDFKMWKNMVSIESGIKVNFPY
ncbi:DUF4105 domain-containing protein [Rhodohalobacter sp. SW132]|uniref:lipoprotein N-acyltransferase Lnb domain-containing protein n=1 Tax=Rhodohalobacter sp. SW132 TaxID=2293433 RepID=UPI000E23F430|nr:DUF4105 domain-containing protein [Rhodohalobacter sp. SW132]REL24833.1 DUF4105 domain-containing protein [Rhodohalobacter sp. SW132]